MKLLFVRHGDPDYINDTLTERGWEEARTLVTRFRDMDVRAFYVSPLGRARDTASCTLKALHRQAQVCDWLQELPVRVRIRPGSVLDYAYTDKVCREEAVYANVAWDILPNYWTRHPAYYHPTAWRDSEIARNSDLTSVYDHVTGQFDALLAEHGYVRRDTCYEVRQANRDSLVFFCHYGVTCTLLAHLMHVSPFILWHSMVFAPTSVTTVCTEEREKGLAYFRGCGFGDISHLWKAGLEPSFSARFCETFDSVNERH